MERALSGSYTLRRRDLSVEGERAKERLRRRKLCQDRRWCRSWLRVEELAYCWEGACGGEHRHSSFD